MDKVQVIKYLDDNKFDKIKFAFADIDGVLRGKVIHRRKFLENLDNQGFCDVVFGWDCADVPYDNAILTGTHTGYPDQSCFIDLSTFRRIPWQENMPFFIADFNKKDGSEFAACPRSLLKEIATQCSDMGYVSKFSQEFEWFNFKETPQSLHDKEFTNIQPITPGMYGYSVIRPSLYANYNADLFKHLTDFGIPVESLHTETGPGVYEITIFPEHVLSAADNAVLLKSSIKEIAYLHGIMASFMAKWNITLPGCSGHIHQSLWSRDGAENLFYDENDAEKMSDLMKHYLAGQIYCLPHILPMYAPTVNSYKRFVEGAWAPIAANWGIDNRTRAFRIINSGPKSTRIETRVPGSDSNPYLAMAAALASGLYGIKNKLPLPSKEAEETDRLHANLFEATNAMKNSTLATELFGEGFVDHFCRTRLWEWQQFTKQVTDWELKRYFEII